jgi:hypothetical protein
MTVSESGEERSLGPVWPDEFREAHPGSFTGRAFKVRSEIYAIGSRIHDQNQRAITAKLTGKPADLPEPKIRETRAHEDLKRLQGLEDALGKLNDESITLEAKLKPHKYDDGVAGASLRSDMKAMLRGADAKTRRELLERPEYRRAALEPGAPPQLSGLTKEAHDKLHADEMRCAFPEVMKNIDDFMVAEDIVKHNIATVRYALQNELKACGAPLGMPKKDKPPKDWEV